MSIDLGRLGGAEWATTLRRHACAASGRMAVVLYPRLRERPPADWRALLRRAREEPLEGWETGAVLGGVLFATWLLRAEARILAEHSLVVVAIVQFALALPVLALTVGPVHVRRTRRGLALVLAERGSVSGTNDPAPEAEPHSSRKET